MDDDNVTTNEGDWYWYSSDPSVLAVPEIGNPNTGSSTVAVTVGNPGSAMILAWYEPSGGTTIGAAVTESIAVGKASINPSVSIDSWTYGETAKTPSVTGIPESVLNEIEGSEESAIVYEYKAKGADDGAYTTVAPDQAGDYTVRATVPETGNYKGGTCTADFAIAEKSITATGSSGAQVTFERTSYTYDGTAKEPAVTSVVLGGKTFSAGTDYTVKYKNNKKLGTATVTVTGKGSYTGSAKATFKIKLGKATKPAAKSEKAKTMTVTWKKVAGAKKYQLQWRVKGGKWKSATVEGAKKVVKGLKAGRTYQSRVRAVAGKNEGAWSKVATCKLAKAKGMNTQASQGGGLTAAKA